MTWSHETCTIRHLCRRSFSLDCNRHVTTILNAKSASAKVSDGGFCLIGSQISNATASRRWAIDLGRYRLVIALRLKPDCRLACCTIFCGESYAEHHFVWNFFSGKLNFTEVIVKNKQLQEFSLPHTGPKLFWRIMKRKVSRMNFFLYWVTADSLETVSYTHLTLPTIYSV